MPGAPTGSFFSRNSRRIEEILNKSIESYLPMLDPVWRDTVVTSQKVGPASQIGRDLKIYKSYMSSFAGVLEEDAPRGNSSLFGDPTTAVGSRMFTQQLVNTFPNALEGANASIIELAIPMRAMKANMMTTMGELQAEATQAFIGEVIAPKMDGWAKLMSHTICNKWWVNQAESYALAVTGTTTLAGAGTEADPYTITFTPQNLAVDRFFWGQRVDLYSTGGTTRRNENAGLRIWMYVTNVDELLGKVTLTVTTGGGTVTNPSTWSLGTTDIVTYANSKDVAGGAGFTSIAGINSWLKSGAAGNNNLYLLGDDRYTDAQINVNTFPEHKSLTKAVNGPLTEHLLRQYLRRFHAAKNKYGMYIDTIVASDGVWLNYLAQKVGREYIDRTDRVASLKSEGNEEGMTFRFDGKTYTMHTSTYVETQTVYGFRVGGGNWARYVPPDPKGARRFDKAPEFIPFRFVGSILTGTESNQIPIQFTTGNSTQLTEGVQMPGILRMQLVPSQPAGMKLTGVTEDRIYSDN